MSVRLDLPPAWKRTPYNETVAFIGLDWTDDDLKMEVRNRPGDTGEPVIALARVASGEGLSTAIDPAYPVPRTSVTAPATILTIRINETTLEALTPSSPTSAPVELFYDLHVGNGVAKRVTIYGRFVITPGVTL